MATVAIHPPKTPVTKGSTGIAAATLPNVCKMPGPPAPFVPTPLPNIGKSNLSPKGYSTTVKIEGNPVAIMGASFKSMGDVASKGTGGGVVSMNCEGQTKFIAPGSLTVKIQGKNVHLLSDIMSNNNGPAGSPPNAATMTGEMQMAAVIKRRMAQLQEIVCECDQEIASKNSDGTPNKRTCQFLGVLKHKCCESKIKNQTRKGSRSGIQGETGYSATGSPPTQLAGPRGSSSPAGSSWPDAIITDGADPPQPQKIVDFKFQCPEGSPVKKGGPGCQGGSPQGWTNYSAAKAAVTGFDTQEDKYRDLTKRMGLDPKSDEHAPGLITNENC